MVVSGSRGLGLGKGIGRLIGSNIIIKIRMRVVGFRVRSGSGGEKRGDLGFNVR